MDTTQQNIVTYVDDPFIEYLINEGFFGNLAKNVIRSIPRKIADSIANKKQSIKDSISNAGNKIKHSATMLSQKVTGNEEEKQMIEDVKNYIIHNKMFCVGQENIRPVRALRDIPHGVMPRAELLKLWDSAKKAMMTKEIDRTALFEDPAVGKFINDNFISTVFVRIQRAFDENWDVDVLEDAADIIDRVAKNIVKIAIVEGQKGHGFEISDYTNGIYKSPKFNGIKVLLPIYNKFAILLSQRLKTNLQRRIKDAETIQHNRDNTVNRDPDLDVNGDDASNKQQE